MQDLYREATGTGARLVPTGNRDWCGTCTERQPVGRVPRGNVRDFYSLGNVRDLYSLGNVRDLNRGTTARDEHFQCPRGGIPRARLVPWHARWLPCRELHLPPHSSLKHNFSNGGSRHQNGRGELISPIVMKLCTQPFYGHTNTFPGSEFIFAERKYFLLIYLMKNR